MENPITQHCLLPKAARSLLTPQGGRSILSSPLNSVRNAHRRSRDHSVHYTPRPRRGSCTPPEAAAGSHCLLREARPRDSAAGSTKVSGRSFKDGQTVVPASLARSPPQMQEPQKASTCLAVMGAGAGAGKATPWSCCNLINNAVGCCAPLEVIRRERGSVLQVGAFH